MKIQKFNIEKKDEIPILKRNMFELEKRKFDLVVWVLEDAFMALKQEMLLLRVQIFWFFLPFLILKMYD